MHKQSGLAGLRQKIIVDLIWREDGKAVMEFGLLAHAGPCIRVNGVGPFYCVRIRRPIHVLLTTRSIKFGANRPKLQAGQRGRVPERSRYVVPIPYVDERPAFKGLPHIHQGDEVRESLTRMLDIAQSVYRWNRRVGCQFFQGLMRENTRATIAFTPTRKGCARGLQRTPGRPVGFRDCPEERASHPGAERLLQRSPESAARAFRKPEPQRSSRPAPAEQRGTTAALHAKAGASP